VFGRAVIRVWIGDCIHGGMEHERSLCCRSMNNSKVKGVHNETAAFQARRNNFRVCGTSSGVSSCLSEQLLGKRDDCLMPAIDRQSWKCSRSSYEDEDQTD
jgi:hypothetical protein